MILLNISTEELRIILKALNEHREKNEKFNWHYANQIDSIAEEVQSKLNALPKI